MSAKALFVAKLNSHPFEDRVLLLDIPVKIGRSHRDDQVIKEQKTFRREQKKILLVFKRKILSKILMSTKLILGGIRQWLF